MTIQVELDPATEARLSAEAEALGVGLEEYAGFLLRGFVPDYPTGTGILTPESLGTMSEKMSKWSEKMPVLPIEANDRESYYGDRC
jgi:hypothetical protein